MGVHGLWRLLDVFGEVTQPEDWRGKRVAVDASIWMAQFRAQCAAGENVEQRILEGFLLRILKLLFYDIHPVFVFDGASTSSKSMEYRRRMERRKATERAAITRLARQIVTAQSAAGALDVGALKRRSPVKTALHAPGDTQAVDCHAEDLLSTLEVSEAAEGAPSGNFQVVRQKRQRENVLEPDLVSRKMTRAFLNEAEEWINERRRCEQCLEANALLYSSTSLFMGPRQVVDKMNDTVAVSTVSNTFLTEREQPITISTDDDSDGVPSLKIEEGDDNDDYNDGNNCGTTSSSAGSDSSVVVVDGRAGTFLGRLYDMEEVESSSLSGSHCDSQFENDELLGNADEFSSVGRNSDDSVCLWNPGTQFSYEKNVKVDHLTINNVSESGSDSESLNSLSLQCVEKRNNDESGVLETCRGPLNVLKTVGSVVEVAPPPSNLLTARRAPPPSNLLTARRVIPHDLLGIVELLDCCGISFLLSPREADAQCAFLSQQHLVDAVFTEDSDVVVHGAAVVLRGFFSKGRHVISYRQSDLLASGVDKDVLVAIALLLGCDYAEGVSGLSLIESLHVIAAVWHHSEDGDCSCCYCRDGGGAAHVIGMLKTWRTAIEKRRFVWDDVTNLVQFCKNRAKWSTLRVTDNFPQGSVVDAFFSPLIDMDMRPFPAASPDWRRLRSFASVHGLLESGICRQRLDLAEKECMTRESRGINRVGRRQRTPNEISAGCRQLGKRLYTKQEQRLLAALSSIRAAREMTC